MIFPIGYNLNKNIKYQKPKFSSNEWLIITGDYNALIASKALFSRWLDSGLLENYAYEIFEFNQQRYMLIASNSDNAIEPISSTCTTPEQIQALSFSLALKRTRDIIGYDLPLMDAIFVEIYSIILSTYTDIDNISDDYLLGYYFTGGAMISLKERKKISKLSSLDSEFLDKIATTHNINPQIALKSTNQAKFCLPGRPELENFFNEHIIDIITNQARYKALGIDSPSSIILYGPPGSGKTYAVDELIKFLDWPSYKIEASTIASPYIHETSKKLAEVFEEAIQNSPSIIVIDEMEAFLTNRDIAKSNHSVEEMAEFLRRIPEAIQNGVLLIAMTNKIELIDPAILRRGRFDHKIYVGYAQTDEIELMLRSKLSQIATQNDIDISKFAQALCGRPMSDISFFIKEGARLAAKNGKDKLDNKSLEEALMIIKQENLNTKGY